MRTLPPGTILQRLHLKGRIRDWSLGSGTFYDVGSGQGELSSLLLGAGLHGTGFDLNAEACALNLQLNAAWVAEGAYDVQCRDFMEATDLKQADVVACSMVIEHWSEVQVDAFLARVRTLLAPGGRLCVLVPGSPSHWGIEDETAGHFRRYTFAALRAVAEKSGLVIRDLRGLTYPLSNMMLRLSNLLVRRSESHKLLLSAQEQTVASGARTVPFKTTFPGWLKVFVNEATLYPFHIAQSLARGNPNSLVIYAEFGRND